jgi:hypothetical protein
MNKDPAHVKQISLWINLVAIISLSIYLYLKPDRNTKDFFSEPICFIGNNIDCSHLIKMRHELFELTSWIDPKSVPFFNKLDEIQNEIDSVMHI